MTQLLEVRGFREKPFVAPRWNVESNDAYGRSPGMDALGDVIQIQVEEKGYAWVSYKNFKAAQKRIGGGQVWSDITFVSYDNYGPRHMIEERAA
jgi:hypothetical protein